MAKNEIDLLPRLKSVQNIPLSPSSLGQFTLKIIRKKNIINDRIVSIYFQTKRVLPFANQGTLLCKERSKHYERKDIKFRKNDRLLYTTPSKRLSGLSKIDREPLYEAFFASSFGKEH